MICYDMICYHICVHVYIHIYIYDPGLAGPPVGVGLVRMPPAPPVDVDGGALGLAALSRVHIIPANIAFAFKQFQAASISWALELA